MDAQQNNQQFQLENVFNVKNRVALITGGGSGISLMTTQALAVNSAKVYITSRTGEKLNQVIKLYDKSIPGQIIPITSDMTSKESIQELVKKIESKEKSLHILINNASISSSTANTEANDPKKLQQELFQHFSSIFDEWERIFCNNVTQLFFTTAAFLPLLQKSTDQDHGWSSTVINISFISSIVKISQHHFAYNASKAATVHLSKMLVHEVTSSGLKIRINSIAPGVFLSEMTAQNSDKKQKSALPKEKYEQKMPAGRPGKEEDMTGVVLFAAATQYLNRQTLVVDGGYVLAAGTV